MKLREMVDEFNNNEITLPHLWKVQAARTHEYVSYFEQLKIKYPQWDVHVSDWELLKDRSITTIGLAKPEAFKATIARHKKIADTDLNKLALLYDRMYTAKNKYETEGGKYET